jgi:hypothetical protein
MCALPAGHAGEGHREADKVLRKAVTLRLVHALAKQCQCEQLADGGRAKGGVRIWAYSCPSTSNGQPK